MISAAVTKGTIPGRDSWLTAEPPACCLPKASCLLAAVAMIVSASYHFPNLSGGLLTG